MPRELTPEQRALQEQRKQKKIEAARVAAQASGDASSGTSIPSGFDISSQKGRILVRDWVDLQSADRTNSLKIMTWNMLAQCLVRRDLFPNSDCLRASQREDMVVREVLTYGADVVCLQEVDRLEKYLPIFKAAQYTHTYASGPKKLHGCMILHRQNLFDKVAERVVFYDDEDPLIQPSTGTQPTVLSRSTRTTKNIGLIVALTRKDGSSGGCFVATTHLFWHPRYVYERTRQAGILVRAVRQLQASNPAYSSWPAYLAGDFNTQPSEATYSLLVNEPLSELQESKLQESRVVHVSRDPSVPPEVNSKLTRKDDEEDESGAVGPNIEEKEEERITNTRPARQEDYLLSDGELKQLYGGRGLRSAYAEGLQHVPEEGDNVFAARQPLWKGKGRTEPMWSSFTHYWRLTLDYIFIIDPLVSRHTPSVVGLLKTHRKENLEPGLPLQGICGSDHVSLVVEISHFCGSQ